MMVIEKKIKVDEFVIEKQNKANKTVVVSDERYIEILLIKELIRKLDRLRKT